jgi:hypothetical protein
MDSFWHFASEHYFIALLMVWAVCEAAVGVAKYAFGRDRKGPK